MENTTKSETEHKNINATEKEQNKAIRNIKENYGRMEKEIVNKLYYQVPHGGTIGNQREKVWGEMFADIVPRKFVIEQSVFIIDSYGNVSNEVDLAIFDETYTPYIFKYGQLKFIPIEAVAVVIECKSTSLDKKKIMDWRNSITALKTSNKSFVRVINNIACGKTNPAKTQKATRPLRILCCLNEHYINGLLDTDGQFFDIVIRANSDEQKLSIRWDDEKKNLYDWYESLNHVGCEKTELPGEDEIKKYKIDDYSVKHKLSELSLMTFNFQLNQVLMLINNPMFFPHVAYANFFNDNEKQEE